MLDVPFCSVFKPAIREEFFDAEKAPTKRQPNFFFTGEGRLCFFCSSPGRFFYDFVFVGYSLWHSPFVQMTAPVATRAPKLPHWFREGRQSVFSFEFHLYAHGWTNRRRFLGGLFGLFIARTFLHKAGPLQLMAN